MYMYMHMYVEHKICGWFNSLNAQFEYGCISECNDDDGVVVLWRIFSGTFTRENENFGKCHNSKYSNFR